MNLKGVLEYLADLESNNGKEWFNANKKRYQEAGAEFEGLLARLLSSMSELDGRFPGLDPRELTYRLNRDTRFSSDKSPYNPTFRACISPAGKALVPVGFYLSVSPRDRSLLGGGLFSTVLKDATSMIRDHISRHGGDLEGIVKNAEFAFAVKGDALKNVPKGFDPNHGQAEYLKNKSWYLEHSITDAFLTSDDFTKEAARIFSRMKPFNDFLNEGLKNFKMPSECRVFGRKTKKA